VPSFYLHGSTTGSISTQVFSCGSTTALSCFINRLRTPCFCISSVFDTPGDPGLIPDTMDLRMSLLLPPVSRAGHCRTVRAILWTRRTSVQQDGTIVLPNRKGGDAFCETGNHLHDDVEMGVVEAERMGRGRLDTVLTGNVGLGATPRERPNGPPTIMNCDTTTSRSKHLRVKEMGK
jgi:hypothetical protein